MQRKYNNFLIFKEAPIRGYSFFLPYSELLLILVMLTNLRMASQLSENTTTITSLSKRINWSSLNFVQILSLRSRGVGLKAVFWTRIRIKMAIMDPDPH